ncbi:MAG: hypothetical protein ABW217_03835 [Polyangiaceae bacterium]
MATRNVVWKYEVSIGGRFDIDMPAGARILTLQLQFGKPVIWAAVDPSKPKVRRTFGLVGTGAEVDFELPDYIGTFQLFDGRTVIHMFEVPAEARTS